MKKLFILSLTFIVSVILFSSCRKNYVCSCTDPDGSSIKINIDNVKSADAEAQCELSSQEWAADGGGSCKLQ